ncbi:MAG: hypothetical protein ACYC2H_10525 [Thermoplasmatota archaeon]
MQRVAVLVLAFALAGCLQIEVGSPTPSPSAGADDGLTTLQVTVVDKSTGEGLSSTQVTLLVPGKGSVRKTTDGQGDAAFTIEPAAACSLKVERAGFRGAAASIDCRKDGRFRVPLVSASADVASTGGPRPARLPSGVDAPGNVLLQGTVLDAVDAEPIAGVRVHLDAPDGPTQRTGLDGAYAFLAEPGDHRLTVSAACWVGVEVPVKAPSDLVFDIQLSANTVPPAAPTGVRATAGPGPGMVTISWDDAPGATGFDLLRGGKRIVALGHSLAYGVPGASSADRFSVASRDACGQVGVAGAEVSTAPLAGPEPMAPVVDRPAVDVGEEAYPAFAPNGSRLDDRRWRTVTGTGNCCENYLTTTPAGRILDQGGSTLAYSDDEGKTWTGVISPLILLAGEGSVAAAPDGDIVAFDWATYNADTAFAYRFSAATGAWQTAQVPVKAPAYDRPWIATIKGPFFLGDLVIPYVSVVEGGIGLKDPLLVSFDGLHYVPSNSLSTFGEAGVDLGVILAAPDSNRDWITPMQEFGIVPVDNGIGIMERQAAMQDSPTWGPVSLPQIPGEILRVDSQGTLHSVSLGEAIEYSISHDGGIHWQRITVPLPSGWSAGEWDFKANAEQDQAVLAVNADVGDDVQQAAFRFRGLDGVPVLTEVLHVGSGGVFGSGVTEQGNRFDFMTLGFLPDGRIVMSAGDAEHDNPFVAIELPADKV